MTKEAADAKRRRWRNKREEDGARNERWQRQRTGATIEQPDNILSKNAFLFTKDMPDVATREDAYTYGDANWKDKLASFDGKAITYDAIGNPWTYDGYTFCWKAGRQLKSMVKGSTNAQFTYDHNGLRVKKTVNGAATSYILHGKQIQHLQKGNDNLHFFYDTKGSRLKRRRRRI